jgi:xanthine/CO dehydrogenase XdhC/CoxF family maturation factor
LSDLEVAVFSTQLTVITDLLKRKGVAASLRQVADKVHDWAGGTDIGGSLRQFNEQHAPRMLNGRTAVILLSDGWDRGDANRMREEMARLRQRARKLLWLNPLLGTPGYQPSPSAIPSITSCRLNVQSLLTGAPLRDTLLETDIPDIGTDRIQSAVAARRPGRRPATVVATCSSPRPVGSHLAVNESGEFAGSVSGGCIEGAVIQEALAAIGDGQPRLLEFGVSDEQAWEVGLACGGRVQVHVEKLDPAIFDHLMRERAARQPVARVIRLSDKTAALVTADDVIGNSAVADSHRAALAARFANGQSGAIDERGDVFARVYVPAPRLLIIGAVHIAQALAPMATMAGFDVTVVDPRRALPKPARRRLDR